MCMMLSFLERFSIECRKTKIKAISLTNHKRRKRLSESEFEIIICNRRQGWENARMQLVIGFGSASP